MACYKTCLMRPLCIVSVLLVSVAQSVPFYFKPIYHERANEGPTPGSIGITAKVSSVNNIFNLAFPLAANEVFYDKDFAVNYHSKGWWGLYDLDLSSIHTNDVVIGSTSLSFVEGTDTLKLRLSEIDIDTNLTGHVHCLGLIRGDIERLVMKNVTFEALVSTEIFEDKVHWQLISPISFSLGDLDITIKQKVWQKIVHMAHSTISKAANNFLAKFIPTFLQVTIDEFNSMLLSDDPMTFETPVGSLPLNFTMTKAMEFRESDDMIEIHFDGRFLYNEDGFNPVTPNTVWQPRLDVPQLEQFLVHESFANSLFNAISNDYLMVFNETSGMSEHFKQMLPELAEYFGSDVSVEVDVQIKDKSTSNAIRFDKDLGIVFGSIADGDLMADIGIYCSNATTEQVWVVQMQTSLELVLNATWNNFVINQQINHTAIANTKLTFDNLGTVSKHADLNAELNDVILSVVNDFNTEHSEGLDIGEIIPTVKFVRGLMAKSIVTPYQEDGFVFAGFRWISDL